MNRNDESLSTRDLASPIDAAPAAATSTETQPSDTLTSAPATAPAESIRTARPESQGSDGQVEIPTDAETQVEAPTEAGTQDDMPRETEAGSAEPLLAPDLSATFQSRWEEVQTRFVDEPRGAVEDADGLVANLMQQLAEGFAQERDRLEQQWGRGEDISTEDLRVALKRYRSFFQRLLST